MRWSSLFWLWVVASAIDDDEDMPVAIYIGTAIGGPQCVAGDYPPVLADVLNKIGHDIPEEPLLRAVNTFKDEGIAQTRQMLELYPIDFDALRIPLLLKTRLRRVRERGGKIPEDMIGHGDAHSAEGAGQDVGEESGTEEGTDEGLAEE